MLVGGHMKKLPGPRDIAEARLCIPINNAIPKATTVIGAALLTKPFDSMRPYDRENIGELIGTTVVTKYLLVSGCNASRKYA